MQESIALVTLEKLDIKPSSTIIITLTTRTIQCLNKSVSYLQCVLKKYFSNIIYNVAVSSCD